MKKIYLTLVAFLLAVTAFGTAPITGTPTVCQGATTPLTDATPGGSWSSSNTMVATVSGGSISGVVTGITAGTTTITYDVSGVYATLTVTVLTTPTPIGGITAVCASTTTVLTDAVAGGIWTTSNSTIAVIGSVTGIVTGVSPGIDTATYTLASGCYVRQTISVLSAPPPISGSSAVCVGSSTPLTDLTSGCTWSSSNPAIASVGSSTGIVSGATAGTATISYSNGPGCVASITMSVTSALGPITGVGSVCVGLTTALTNATPGGLWSSSNSSIASTGTAAGVVTGVAAGTATITYSLGSSCITTTTVTVNLTPGAITGAPGACLGATTTLSNATPGGVWTSGTTTVATVGSTGVVLGVALGGSNISYTLGGCNTFVNVHISVVPGAITGLSSVCPGSSITMSNSVLGGTWMISSWSIASIGSGTGIVSGVSAGTATVTYMTGASCYATHSITVSGTASPILGTKGLCVGGTSTLSNAISGGGWISSAISVANFASSASGIVSAVSAGTAIITYSLGVGCDPTTVVTVDPTPSVSVTLKTSCGNDDSLIASGAASYSWAPSSGLSCTTCRTTVVNPSATTTYTITGSTTIGCSNTTTTTVNGDRIFGHITFSSFTPDTLDMKVWLIQYNPLDSSIKALDSVMTCVVDSVTFYEFNSKPAGNYMVKAKMIYGSPAGSSGYVPTYGVSAPVWSSASSVAHTGGSDSIHINMIYGTVPPGPGFISGNVYFGAGKTTGGGTPVAGMLIYLKNTATNILTYVYTDAAGTYTFSGLAYGSYVIYPEEYQYNTTPSAITIDAANPSAHAVDFKQYTTSKKIMPYSSTGIVNHSANSGISVHPNPASDKINITWQNKSSCICNVIISDLVGHEVLKSALSINVPSGQSAISLAGLNSGIYFISVKSGDINYNSRIIVQK